MHPPHRPRVGVDAIPNGARQPINPSPSAYTSPFAFSPPALNETIDVPWDDWDVDPPSPPPKTIHHSLPRRRSSILDKMSSFKLDRSRTANAVVESATANSQLLFPEPHFYRSSSSRPSLGSTGNNTSLGHRVTKSDVGHSSSSIWSGSTASLLSTNSSYAGHNVGSFSTAEQEPVPQSLSNEDLVSEIGLRKFQEGTLPDADQEWHRLVPMEAREALGKQEVQRQSVIFEVFKAEREYVADLEAVQDVFVGRLRAADPPIISKRQIAGFICEVFGNLSQILAHHQRMLAALLARQREQHPLIQSIADVVLDTALKADFLTAYETYIKHYPLSESHHRKELNRNPAYKEFIQSASSDPRIRKRDLITFLSRPVTRLPRLNLLLEQILKLTDKDYNHPDLETLPITISIVNDCIKSTQPGIEAAESKVKFWALCESLIYQDGEIIDMDLYDDSRSLVYSGPLIRRTRDEWLGWTDLTVALLDNYLLFTREEVRTNGEIRRHLTSRPLPLSYLRLGSFDAPSETRKEHAKDGRLLENLRYIHTPLYPFTVYHAVSKSNRRYTLYASSEALRSKWKEKLVDALAIFKARQDGNMWFDPRVIVSRMVRVNGSTDSSGGKDATGRPLCAVPFTIGGRKWLALGTSSGIHISSYGENNFKKVLHMPNVTSIAATSTHNNKVYDQFIVLYEGALLCYSLDMIVKVAVGRQDAKSLDASLEKLDTGVVFFRAAYLGKRVLLIYASKGKLKVTPTLAVLEAVDFSSRHLQPKRPKENGTIRSFRPFGESGYIPKDAYDVVALARKIAVITQDALVILDPANIAKSVISLVPEWGDLSNNQPMSSLKSRADSSRPLGMIRCENDQLLVIYDIMGFYVTKHGKPARASGFIKWESKAMSYAYRAQHILLFSPQFIEIRDINTGRMVQAIEGSDIRLLHSGTRSGFDSAILVAMRASAPAPTHGTPVTPTQVLESMHADKVVELAETTEVKQPSPEASLWDGWDM